MTGSTRRRFGLGVALASAFGPRMAYGQARPRIVVVGGGIGGATVVKYLSGGGFAENPSAAPDVTLVEPRTRYTTCFFSNLHLAGLWSLASLMRGYEQLGRRSGVSIVHDRVTVIDPETRRVRLGGGGSLPFDRLVVSPGIAFRPGAIEGYDEAAAQAMPHAWVAGEETGRLRAQLEAMEDGGVFVICPPPAPYRCLLGPYERASLAAYYFKQFKPRSKVLILDAKDVFPQQALFEDGWNRHYPGMIEWLPARSTGGVAAVDAEGLVIRTANGSFKASVANVIPAQTAGDLALSAGLADASGWCPIDPATFESTLQPGIHVIGDAAKAGDMPKSGSCAASQGKTCAFALLASIAGQRPSSSHLLDASYSFLAGHDAVSEAATFDLAEGTIRLGAQFLSKIGDSAERRKKNTREALGWYDAFTNDVFG